MQGSKSCKEKIFAFNSRQRPNFAGQSLLEFVLTLPLLLFVLLLIIQIGIGLYAQSIVTGAAQEGARVAAEADKAIVDGIGTVSSQKVGAIPKPQHRL